MLDTEREVVLGLILGALTRHGTLIDPKITMTGEPIAAEAARGTLLIGTHRIFGPLMIRALYDAGIRVTAMSEAPFTVPGTREECDTLQGKLVLRKIALRLRAGGFVAAVIDRGDLDEPNLIELTTTRGTLRIMDTVVRLAIHQNARILFFSSHLKDSDEVVVDFEAPSGGSGATVEAVTRDFISFIQRHVSPP